MEAYEIEELQKWLVVFIIIGFCYSKWMLWSVNSFLFATNYFYFCYFSWWDLCQEVFQGPMFIQGASNSLLICLIIYKMTTVWLQSICLINSHLTNWHLTIFRKSFNIKMLICRFMRWLPYLNYSVSLHRANVYMIKFVKFMMPVCLNVELNNKL